MILNVLSVCLTVLVLTMHYADPTSEVPAWIVQWLVKFRKRAVHKIQVQEGINVADPTAFVSQNATDQVITQDEKANRCWKWKELANVVNNVCFGVIALAYLVMVCFCGTLWSQA